MPSYFGEIWKKEVKRRVRIAKRQVNKNTSGFVLKDMRVNINILIFKIIKNIYLLSGSGEILNIEKQILPH